MQRTLQRFENLDERLSRAALRGGERSPHDEVEERAVPREELLPRGVLSLGAATQEEDILGAHAGD